MEAIISEYITCVIEAAMTMFFCLYVAHDRIFVRLPILALWVAFLSTAGSAASMALAEWLKYLLPFTMDYSMFTLPFWFIIGCLCLRRATGESPSGRLFILLLSVQVLHLCRSVTYFLYGLFFPGLTDGVYRWVDILGFGLPSIILTLLLSLFCYRLFQKLQAINLREYLRIWIIPLFFMLLYLVQTNLYPVGDFNLANGFRIMIGLCSFLTYSQMASSVSHAAKAAQKTENLAQLAHQLDLQQARVEDMESHAEEIKRIRHDRRQHVKVLRGLLEKGQIDQALKYLDDYEGSMAAAVQPALCENFVADTLCRRYETLATQSAIEVTMKISLPPASGVAGSDLAIILGNLWENAVAAALDTEGANRFIRLCVLTREDHILMRMENGYGKPVQQEGDRFLSTKSGRDHTEGIGISSIRAVSQRYGGMADFTYTACIFTASVLLPRR